MGKGIGDLKFAADLRDIVTRMARKAIDENVPQVRIGKVYKLEPDRQTAYVLFPGETVDNLVRVRCGKNMIPMQTMEAAFPIEGYDAAGDVVRVWGKPGGYFILDFVSGGPNFLPTMWIEPELLNGWENYGSPWGPARYHREGNKIHLAGLIRNGATNTNAFILETEYRPLYAQILGGSTYQTNTQNPNTGTVHVHPVIPSHTRIGVGVDGAVTLVNGSPTWVCLDGLYFFTN